jgi:maleylacetoacetate isomerase
VWKLEYLVSFSQFKMAFQDTKLTRYSYFRSSCSARVRTAAALKGIPLNYEYLNLLENEQSAESYTSIVNPSGTVPTLMVEWPPITEGGRSTRFLVRQSVAILEFFGEAFPDSLPLLPSPDQPAQRAQVRELVNILAADFQPWCFRHISLSNCSSVCLIML